MGTFSSQAWVETASIGPTPTPGRVGKGTAGVVVMGVVAFPGGPFGEGQLRAQGSRGLSLPRLRFPKTSPILSAPLWCSPADSGIPSSWDALPGSFGSPVGTRCCDLLSYFLCPSCPCSQSRSFQKARPVPAPSSESPQSLLPRSVLE